MGSAFERSLIDKCHPAPWHQAIFLTEKIINETFENMWILADSSSPLRSFKLNISIASIDIKIAAPTVIMNVVDHGFTLFLQLNIISGDFKSVEDYDDPDKQKTFDVSRWTVAFGSIFGREDFAPGSEMYEHYRKAMDVPVGGNFKITQLFLKSLENASWYPEGSNFQGTDWAAQTDVVKLNFSTLRGAWLSQLRKRGSATISVFGTTPDPAKVNEFAPTFPPTSIDYVTYPWKDPSRPTDPTNSSNANALAYLIMTSNTKAPVPPAISYTGTWVTTSPKDPNRDATFCMSSSQFWEGWLLPLLQVANLTIQMQPTEPTLYKDGSTYYYNIEFDVGTCTKHKDANDKYYEWTKAADGRSWTWTADEKNLKSFKEVKGDSSERWFTEQAWAYGDVKFDVGGKKITVNNSSDFFVNYEAKRKWPNDDGWLVVKWKLTSIMSFSVERIDDGGLQLWPLDPDIKASEPWHEAKHISFRNDVQEYVRSQCSKALTKFKNAQRSYWDKLLKGLSHQNKLVLPGAGAYLFSNVMFNARGDLVTNLAFNGATLPGQPKKIPTILAGLPRRRTIEDYAVPVAEPDEPMLRQLLREIETTDHLKSPAVLEQSEIDANGYTITA